MKVFMDTDFLLTTPTARTLYHDHAAQMPVVDYHCHINPAEIAENRSFSTITQAWLGGDHYKWRLTRHNGVDERLITGNGDDREKFQAFAEAMSKAAGNPVYHWVHLELQRYFDCHTPLNGDTAESIWNHCNQRLKTPELSVRGIIKSSRVTHIVTTDDPVDSLEHHAALHNEAGFETTVLPAWRPDKAMNIEKDEFMAYIETLSKAADMPIQSWADIPRALAKRMDHFETHGCRASDHGLNACLYAPATDAELEDIVSRRFNGAPLTSYDVARYKYAVLLFLGREYARRDWVMELHYAAVRNVNTPAFQSLGPDTGYDAISGDCCGNALPQFLNALHQDGFLPKTLIFSLNPNDNAVINTVANGFLGPDTPGRVQQGSAWWFNDTRTGMVNQMTSFAELGLLGNFVGMLTDSRSFLSYTRHEYFRRILCDMLGNWVERGEYPADIPGLGNMVEDISYRNAIRFFRF